MWLEVPDVTDIGTGLEDTIPFPNNSLGYAVQSDSMDHISISWEEPEKDITGMCKRGCN